MNYKASLFLIFLSAPAFASEPTSCDEDKAQRVSMRSLINSPQAWNGKLVQFVGFVRYTYEGDAVFTSKHSVDADLTEDAIALGIIQYQYGKPTNSRIDMNIQNGRRVVIQGTYISNNPRVELLSGIENGHIEDICFIRALK